MLAREASVPLRVDGGLRDDVDRVIDVHGQFGRRRDRDVFAANPVVREESDRSEQGVRRDGRRGGGALVSLPRLRCAQCS